MPDDAGNRLVIGCMTGTSCDGLDAVLVRLAGVGLAMQAEVVDAASGALGAVGQELLAFANGAALTAGQLLDLRRRYMQLHADLLQPWADRADLIALHGQTVFHQPPLSWQLADGAWLAQTLGVRTVWDLRAADLAQGGQGAPITPLADLILFGDVDQGQAIVNLGGFCNMTLLPAGADPAAISGFDCCTCCQLLDGLARERLNQPYDADGAVAAAGRPEPAVVADLVKGLQAQRQADRSLGSGDELVALVAETHAAIATPDLLAATCQALGEVIAEAAAAAADRLVLAGGGVRHPVLRQSIVDAADRRGAAVVDCDACGVASQWREAAGMAVLGALAQDRVPITLPQVTGVTGPAPLAGVWAEGGSAPLPVATSVPTLTAADDDGLPDRSHVLSEQRQPLTADLHHLDVPAAVAALQRVDDALQPALRQAGPALAGFIAAAAPGFARGGRLIYVGAGTSGRLGVLDAAEAPPTFRVPPGRIIGVIAGGERALVRSSEGLEDEPDGAVPELAALDLGPDDAVLGIAAGGTTPYPRGAVSWAADLLEPPMTGFLSCSPCDPPTGCGHLIVVPTGAEALTGSTRMKAGTATKQALNTISTLLMVQAGRVHGNLMVDVKATNAKLRDRAARIISTLTAVDRPTALDLVDAANGSVKVAVLMQRLGLDRRDAEAALAAVDGRLDQALG